MFLELPGEGPRGLQTLLQQGIIGIGIQQGVAVVFLLWGNHRRV
jgi:hypothetical protein